MGDSVRIQYRENSDLLLEAQSNALAQPAPLVPQKAQRMFFGALIVVGLSAGLYDGFREGHEVRVLVIAAAGSILILGFWFWLFRRLGLFKNVPAPVCQLTERDRRRVKHRYRSLAGRDENVVDCEFDGLGFRLSSDHSSATQYKWSSVVRVVERPMGLQIYFRRWTYFWFPRTAFAGVGDYPKVTSLIARHVRRFERVDGSRSVFVAIGSNLGDSARIVLEAIARLQELSDVPLLQSALWQTSPVDCPSGSPPFVNAVVGLAPRAGETPESLLAKLQALEREFGRRPKLVLNEPRPLDLDLIAFGSERRNTPELALPHPRAHLRRFVLQPLIEIAPDLVLPGQTRSVAELLAALETDEALVQLAQ